MHKLSFPILHALSDGHFHSGEALAKRFDISRGTVFNAIKSAQDAGVRIFSVRGKGYQLPRAIHLLSSSALKAAGLPASLSPLVEIHPVLDSTNQHLRKQLSVPPVQNRIVACNLQTAGRGRRGRQWQSQLGESLTFSIAWQFQCGAAALTGLSLSIGTALIHALHQLGYNQTALKWPNDIVVPTNSGIKKLAGILIELQGDLEGPSTAIIGIGLNLALTQQTQDSIDQPVTDLAQLQSNEDVINPNRILATLLQSIIPKLSQYEKLGFISDKPDWLEHDAFKGNSLTIIQTNGNQVTGKMHDLSDDGALILQTEQGLMRFFAGEVSLRAFAE